MASLKPGQKFPTPTPGFGDRVFYETLLRQRPDSHMAQQWYACVREWCVEYGILPEQEAEQLYKKVLKRKGKGPGSAVSTPSPVKKKKKPVKVMRDDGVDPDMQISSGDGIGRAVL